MINKEKSDQIVNDIIDHYAKLNTDPLSFSIAITKLILITSLELKFTPEKFDNLLEVLYINYLKNYIHDNPDCFYKCEICGSCEGKRKKIYYGLRCDSCWEKRYDKLD